MRTIVRAFVVSVVLSALAATAPAGDISGKWLFTFDTPGGVRGPVPYEFVVDGDKVTATSEGATLTGTFRDGKLDLSGDLYSEEAGYKAKFVLSGNESGDQLRGNCTWDAYEMTFTAKRGD